MNPGRRARRQFAIKNTPLDPRVFVKLTDNRIELGLVCPEDTHLRQLFRSEIGQYVLAGLATAVIVTSP